MSAIPTHQPTRQKLLLGVGLVVVLGGLVFFLRPKTTPGDPRLNAPMSTLGTEGDAIDRSEEVHSRSALRENVHTRLREAGIEGQSALNAADAVAQYSVGMADRSIDRLVDLAILHNAKPDERTLSTSVVILETAPPRLQPRGWRDWNDVQKLRFVFEMSPDRWPKVAVQDVSVRRVRGKNALVNETEFYITGLMSDGGVGAVYNAPFILPDLERKLQQGEAEALIVTFPVTKQDGDGQMVSVLLGEYAPGKWFPVRHKTVSYSSESRANIDGTVRAPAQQATGDR